MCGSTTRSWQGDPLRVPVASPRQWRRLGIEPIHRHQTYRRFTTRRPWRCPSPPAPNHGSRGVSPTLETHSQRDVALPAPIDLRAFLPPKPQTISWRRFHRDQERELSRCPSHGPIPSTNPARFGCRQPIGAEPEHGAIAPLVTPLAGAGELPLWSPPHHAKLCVPNAPAVRSQSSPVDNSSPALFVDARKGCAC